ncbi:glycosyltransferase family 2 protein [Flavobacterium sp. F-380]|uniref:Glycosyltransferase family 2 protein n=1 Tax=Flavobacterium kayseriense TaxID=2764714 RepID=A0ABR7J7J1_9FLAO|nr:glycosyltransferase [Flavobacterium kayseriense]MBC5841480.1 glycosyltransferase family 2 protein [Flavobacterium kayseriense]MBC5848008.1 glycosyltransferase family 2 protein [Flavobacterium kayseriense]
MNNQLAIIIPFFKLTFFEDTLVSLANQTSKEFTVYIGDDSSPEDCSLLIAKYKDRFNLKYHRFATNLGGTALTQQWDRCISLMAMEEWFMILGDDDYLGDTVVEEFYNAIAVDTNDTSVIRNASLLINQEGDPISPVYKHPQYEEAIASYCRKLNNETRSSLSEHIFRTSAYKKYGFKDYKLAWSSDDRAIIDFSSGKPIFSTDAIVYVRMSDLNISGGKDNIQEKISGRLAGTHDLLKDYSYKMNIEQIKLFIALYENLIYRSASLQLKHSNYLLQLSIKYFGIHYVVKQLQSLVHKLVSKPE